MTKNDFKYATISLLLINIWTLYGFFDYYTEPSGMFHGLGLLIFFVYSLFFGIGIGIILLLSRTLYFKKEKKNKIINNLFYMFSGIFSLNLFLIWSTAIILKVLSIDDDITFSAILNLIISTVIFIDIYRFRKISK
jgi:hypothetical protein